MKFTQEDWSELETILLENPEVGDVIQGMGGARKIRIPLDGQGKSGGIRVIVDVVMMKERLYFLYGYPKNLQIDLTAAQKKELLNVVEAIKKEVQ